MPFVGYGRGPWQGKQDDSRCGEKGSLHGLRLPYSDGKFQLSKNFFIYIKNICLAGKRHWLSGNPLEDVMGTMVTEMWRVVLSLLSVGVLLVALGGFFWLSFRTRLGDRPDEALRAGEELLRSRRVLAFVAHPDDAEWWIGGTLRRLVLAGAKVCVVVASDGERGRNRIGAEDLRATRREEQRAAGAVLGYSEVIFWGLPDREVSAHPDVSRLILEEVRKYQPDLVLTFDPRLPALPYLHPDHEGLGHVVFEVWHELERKPALVFFHTRRPNVAVNITDAVEEKVRALLMHRSQNLGRGGGRNRAAHRSAGEMVGVPYAELFRRVVG